MPADLTPDWLPPLSAAVAPAVTILVEAAIPALLGLLPRPAGPADLARPAGRTSQLGWPGLAGRTGRMTFESHSTGAAGRPAQ